MASITGVEVTRETEGSPSRKRLERRIPVFAFGMSLGCFFVISYVVCVIGYLLFPSLPIEHSALSIFLPGFTLLSWPAFFLGLVESFF